MEPELVKQWTEILWPLGLATAIGATLGVNRDLHHKPAGLRVLSLVAMGSCVMMLASMEIIALGRGDGDTAMRTVQGVLSGIGFLGAGVIMRAHGTNEVHGLTTAASIWISAILGMACGMGQWRLTATGFLLAWIIIVGGRWIEHVIVRWTASGNDSQPQQPSAK